MSAEQAPRFVRFLAPDGEEMVALWEDWQRDQACQGCQGARWDVRRDGVVFCLTCTPEGATQGTVAASEDLELVGARIVKLLGTRSLTEADIRRRAGSTRTVSDALRLLLREERITRSGEGKRGSPYTYQIARSETRSISSSANKQDSRSVSHLSPSERERENRFLQGNEFSHDNGDKKAGTSFDRGEWSPEDPGFSSLVAAGSPLEEGEP